MQPSLVYQIEQAIRQAGHRSNAWDTGWDNFLNQVTDLLAQAVEYTDEIPIAIDLVFAKVTGYSQTMADGDHHSLTYGQEIGHWIRLTGAAMKLAQDTQELKRLIKAKKDARRQCPDCLGSGKGEEVECSACHGRGFEDHHFDCHACGGSGRYTPLCERCKGTGKI